MKQKLNQQLCLFILLSAFPVSSFAQNETNTEFINRMNYVFSPLEKNRVPNGLLLDYAMEFADLKSYNGILTDSNKVNAGLLKDIYSTITMSAIHTNAGGFYSSDYADNLWQTQRQPRIITLSGLYYNYSRFRDDAVNAGLVATSNDQFYDRYVNGVWQNPYQTETVFAMSPPLHTYSGKSLQVKLPSSLWFTNSASSVSSIAINFNDGAGYRAIAPDQAINISYTDTGTKTWVFRLALTNGTTLYSHTVMKIEPEPNAYGSSGCSSCRFPRPGGPVPLTADNAFNGQFGQGLITVDYANADLLLRRPLIVVEGFDPGHLITPEEEFGQTSFGSFSRQVRDGGSDRLRNLLQGDLQQYDIIYVDWANGTDFLQRNGLLLERVIRWVNDEKVISGSTQPNVVLGQSMGGVISRWALRDMEIRGLSHQTRLFISWDAPHQGANVPVAYQHGVRHLNSQYVQSAIPTLLGGSNINRIVTNALNLIDEPAARQMLINRVLDNGQINNSEHNTWQLELRNLGYPQQHFNGVPIKNVAVSNGSECGIGQGFQPNADLVSVNGRVNTRFLADLYSSFTGWGWAAYYHLAAITGYPQFMYGIAPGRNDLFVEVNCKAQPQNASTQIYKAKITYRKKLLWLVNINMVLTDRSRNADPSILPLDGTPGGMYDSEVNLQDQANQNWFYKYNISASNIPHFNFIPTTSALDIGGGNTTLTLANHHARYIGATPPAFPLNTPFANFITAFNQVGITNGQINNNEDHILIAARNAEWVADELNTTPTLSNCSFLCANNIIVGPETVCPDATYTVPQAAGAPITWTVDNQNIAQVDPTTGTVTRLGNGQAVLSATITTPNCGTGTVTINKTITVGFPEMQSIIFQNGSGTEGYFCTSHAGNQFEVLLSSYPANSAIQYRLLSWPNLNVVYTDPTLYSTGGPISVGSSYATGWYVLEVKLYTACGSTEWTGYEVEFVDCSLYGGRVESFAVTASPNPAKDDLFVSTDKEKDEVKALRKDADVFIDLYDFYTKQLIKQWRYKNDQKQWKLSVRGIKKGQYVLQVRKDKYRGSKIILIE